MTFILRAYGAALVSPNQTHKKRRSRAAVEMQIHSVGIDLGKTTFHLVALGETGKVLLRDKFTQKHLLAYTANMQPSLIGLEACPLPRSGAAQAGARCPADSSPVCEALREVEQERLHRRGDDRRGVERKKCALFRSRRTISWICRRSSAPAAIHNQ